ncbi:uncharacterized protein G2W53_034087 [Senna tora]|uniref:Uncharacterized protein n=1 Tax=Senna tora TaxID=362788 RepID=A0A834WBK3_9FABA|nr:uncharacterized protein G2W53_034087 [Senna tora]
MARISSVEGCVNGTDLHRPLPVSEFMNSFKSQYSGSEKMVDDGLFRVEAKNDVVLVLACGSNENFEELVNMAATTEVAAVVVESLGDDGSGRVEGKPLQPISYQNVLLMAQYCYLMLQHYSELPTTPYKIIEDRDEILLSRMPPLDDCNRTVQGPCPQGQGKDNSFITQCTIPTSEKPHRPMRLTLEFPTGYQLEPRAFEGYLTMVHPHRVSVAKHGKHHGFLRAREAEDDKQPHQFVLPQEMAQSTEAPASDYAGDEQSVAGMAVTAQRNYHSLGTVIPSASYQQSVSSALVSVVNATSNVEGAHLVSIVVHGPQSHSQEMPRPPKSDAESAEVGEGLPGKLVNASSIDKWYTVVQSSAHHDAFAASRKQWLIEHRGRTCDVTRAGQGVSHRVQSTRKMPEALLVGANSEEMANQIMTEFCHNFSDGEHLSCISRADIDTDAPEQVYHFAKQFGGHGTVAEEAAHPNPVYPQTELE